jgi:acetate kinase
MAKYFIVNPGSDSKKYALYEDGTQKLFAHFEREGGKIVVTVKKDGPPQKTEVSQKDYDSSLEYLLQLMVKDKILAKKTEISGVGVRVVAPGNYFAANKIIDGGYLEKLQKASRQAPLHLKPVILEIENLNRFLPEISMVGISDSAFHANLPKHSRFYNLPQEMAEKFEIYRFGYHGISAQSVLNKIKIIIGNVPPKTIICHLGSGSSIHAVKDGAGFDTTMGFTPLEGLTMGTRIGNIDAGAVLFLLQESGMSPAELEDYFNTKCGLLGLSGKTPDIRELIELEKAGDANAKIALDAFIYSVRKYIGAYTAVLGGLDLLVFTATIGERSSIMRERICRGLTALGIVIDDEQNDQTISRDGLIHKEKESSVKVAVTVTDEMGQMAKETTALCDSATL